MDPITLYGRGLELFTDRLSAVADDQWGAPTPCEEWDVRDLVAHVVEGTRLVAPMLDGQDGAEVPATLDDDLLGDDPTAAFRSAATEARTALARPGAAETTVRLGPDSFPGAFLALASLADLVIHTWDLATATRTDAALPDDLVDAAAGFYDDMEEAYREAGYLGEPVPVGSDADAQTRLLARLGRSAQAPVGN